MFIYVVLTNVQALLTSLFFCVFNSPFHSQQSQTNMLFILLCPHRTKTSMTNYCTSGATLAPKTVVEAAHVVKNILE